MKQLFTSRTFSAAYLPVIALLGITAVAATSLLAGCGGGSSSFLSPGGSQNAPPFGGAKLTGRVTLADGQTGDIVLSTGANNAASATLTVSGAARSRQALVVIATSVLSGTYDPATGAFHLSGSYTVNGQLYSVDLQGTFPTPPATSGGSIRITINGHTYTSAFGFSPAPSPSPSPSAVPSPLPSFSPSPSPTPSPAPGTLNLMTVAANGGNATGAQVGSWKALRVEAGGNLTANATSPQGGFLSMGISESASGVGQRTIAIDVSANGPLVPGTYSPASIVVEYMDKNGSWQNSLSAPLPASQGGQIVIEQVDGAKVRLRLENVLLDPFSVGSQGSLRVSGTAETTIAPTFSK